MQETSIFIAEDSPNVRDNLEKIISKIDGLKVVGKSENVKDSITFAQNYGSDVYLIDIGLQDGSGLDLLKYLRSMENIPQTIIYTNYVTAPYKIMCNKLGADFFLDKIRDFDKLMNILEGLPSNGNNLVVEQPH